jgi:purine-nucleoside/S-methyl-5'-thioadenosine phosphorylase / adenosine deaminase
VKEIVNPEGLVYYQFDQWPELKHGVFTRRGGVSQPPFATLNLGGNVGDDPKAVRHNHELMYSALGVRGDRACTVWQVHSADTLIVSGPVAGRRWIAQADGMVTDRSDTPLAMRFADCTPILLYDPVRGVIGMAHAGWRGTVQGVAAGTAQLMVQAYGCKPSDIQAAIGPSIGPERYQVGEEVVAAIIQHFGAADGLIRRDPADGTAYLDLWAANRLDLQRVGVEQIEIAGICTAQHTDQFFSHRAEKGHTGRFGAVMSL